MAKKKKQIVQQAAPSSGEDRSSAGVEPGEAGVPESYTGQFLKPMLEGKT